MLKVERLIFVCKENTSRSIMAEFICRNMMGVEHQVEIMSRGLVVLFPEPINPKTEIVLINHGMNLQEQTAVQLKEEDFTNSTLVLTMDQKQKESIMRDFEKISHVHTLKEYVSEDGDVMNPYGGTLVDYEECYVELVRLIKKTVIKLNKCYEEIKTESTPSFIS